MSAFDGTFTKDAGATLDYQFDFKANTNGDADATDWLQTSEVIDSYVLTVPSGLTLVDDYLSSGSTVVTYWISGGTVNNDYEVSVTITTNSSPVNRVDNRHMVIQVRDL